MRTGTGQKLPTASPLITVTIGTDVYKTEGGGGSERVMRAYTDEQGYGGQYTIELDNSDEALIAKDYEGKMLTLNMSFIGETSGDFPPLWVWSQQSISKAGKILLQLNCVDIWAFIAAWNSTLANASYNQEWQQVAKLSTRYMADGVTLLSAGDPTLYATLLANGNKTILAIIQDLCTGMDINLAAGDTDSYINTLKPPISISNGRTGLWQLMDYTKSYLKYTTACTLIPYQPDLHATVFTFDTINTFYSEVDEAGVVIPNRVIFWSYNETGTAWIRSQYELGYGVDAESYGKVERYVDRHYLVADIDNTNMRTQAELNTYADAALAKLKAEVNQGFLVAPMHCTLELFDKVEVTDDRYTVPRTITGYIHRLVREYDRGVYRITVYLGGVAGGYTPPGGSPGNGMTGEVPVAPAAQYPPGTVIPVGYQPYIAAINFTSVDWDTVSWLAGNVTFGGGTNQPILAGSFDMTASGAWYFYATVGSTSLTATQSYADCIGETKVLVAVASRGSSTAVMAYIFNPFTDSILINRDKVMNGLVTELQLANEAVTNAKIAVDAIYGSVIAASAITQTKIADNSISSPKIIAAAITAAKIDTGAVTATKIAALAVTTEKIAASAVTAEKINAGAVTAIKISASAVEADKIAAGAVTADKLYSNLVLSTTIKTAATGSRVELSSAGAIVYGTGIKFYYGATEHFHVEAFNLGVYLYCSVGNIYMMTPTGYGVSMYNCDFLILPRLASMPIDQIDGYMVWNSATGNLNVYSTSDAHWWHMAMDSGWL